jgi:hypothetical protein
MDIGLPPKSSSPFSSQFFRINFLSALVLIHGKMKSRERERDLKMTTGTEATISLALASAIALDSGFEDEEELKKRLPFLPLATRIYKVVRGTTKIGGDG